MAQIERHVEQSVAASWFSKGEQQLKNNDVVGALRSFRKATNNDKENRKYSLILANSLATAGNVEEARYALLRVRESEPENAEVNLDLAHLEARQGNIAEASRYYHNALYGLWTGANVNEQQREIRIELIRFLLAHQERNAALSELLILESGTPDEVTAQVQVARLFMDADDPSHALQHFVEALHLNKRNAVALSGAGEAEFRLAHYDKAARYFESSLANEQVDDKSEKEIRSWLSTTRLILSIDPGAPHLIESERTRRLLNGVHQLSIRVNGCLAGAASDDSEIKDIQSELLAESTQLQSRHLGDDPKWLDTGISLLDRGEEITRTKCGEPREIDKALVIICRKYNGGEQ